MASTSVEVKAMSWCTGASWSAVSPNRTSGKCFSASRRSKSEQQIAANCKRFPKARWVKPVVMVDAEFRGKTGDGLLRHPAFKGFRADLKER